MKKRTLLTGAGTLVLAIAAVFAGKASAKFGTASVVYASEGTGSCIAILSSNSNTHFTTVAGTSKITFSTSGGAGTVNFYGSSNCLTKPLYWKP